MGPIDCAETSVKSYHYSLRNNPKEHSSHYAVLNVIFFERRIGSNDDKKFVVCVKILVGNFPRKTVEIYGSLTKIRTVGCLIRSRNCNQLSRTFGERNIYDTSND